MAITYITDPEYHEVFLGGVHPKVSPTVKHAVLAGTFVALFSSSGKRFGQTGPEWRMHIDTPRGRVELLPDVSFYAYEQLRTLSDDARDYSPCAPLVAVEIRSVGDSLTYLVQKIAVYLAHGSAVVFDVDPTALTITAHTGEGDVRVLPAEDHFSDNRIAWLSFRPIDIFADLDFPED